MLFPLHTLRLQIRRRSYSHLPKGKGSNRSKCPNSNILDPSFQAPLSALGGFTSGKLGPILEKPAVMKKFARQLDTESFSNLPQITYPSEPSYKLFYAQDTTTANEVLDCLKGNVLGMDMEWRATFRGGQQSKTALLQLCDDKSIMLLQVCRMKEFPEKLRLILEDRNIIKTGLYIQGDALKLARDYGILVNGLAELGYAARHVGYGWRKAAGMPSLQECVAVLLGKYLAKGPVRLSNWELELNPKQIEYAATDVYVSYVLYRHIEHLWPKPGPIVNLVHMADEVANKEKIIQQKRDDKAKKQRKKSAGDDDPESPPKTPRPSAPSAALRAYDLWHHKGLSIEEIGALCRTQENPLKGTTVVSYLLKAIQMEGVPYDRKKLRAAIEQERYWRYYKVYFAKQVPL